MKGILLFTRKVEALLENQYFHIQLLNFSLNSSQRGKRNSWLDYAGITAYVHSAFPAFLASTAARYSFSYLAIGPLVSILSTSIYGVHS